MCSESRRLDRRRFAAVSLAAGAGFAMAAAELVPKRALLRDRRRPYSSVAVLRASSYSEALEATILDGLRLFNLRLKGKTVLLKPNIVEYAPDVPINTHPVLVGATATAFMRLGAGKVVVAEGPGHVRDTFLLLEESGFREALAKRGVAFVDLNRDDVVRTRAAANYSGLAQLWIPKTVLAADLVVSMPKLKTHHWAGVTLSMKNMFGVLPGDCYGWPKNVLHWHGIHESVLDICATVMPHFVIADAIVGMEGNGPLNGQSRGLGYVVLADDPVSADFTCARLMGLNPLGVPHLREASLFLGNGAPNRIAQLAEPTPAPNSPFAVLPTFGSLQMTRP